MNKEKVMNLLGLAQRAGKLVSGDFAVERTIKREKTRMVFLATDCATNNSKKYIQMAETYEFPLYQVLTRDEMGQAIGKEMRVVILVKDSGFAKALQQAMEI